ncbi:MAG: hypothetical protein AB3N14_06045 [Flavobacteriaceae bacterium]
MQDLPTLHIVSFIISFFGQLIVFVACVLLLIKQRSPAALLMLVGISLSALFSVLGLLMTSLSAQESPEAVIRTQGIFSILNTLSYLLFGLGLLLLAIKTVRKRKIEQNNGN